MVSGQWIEDPRWLPGAGLLVREPRFRELQIIEEVDGIIGLVAVFGHCYNVIGIVRCYP